MAELEIGRLPRGTGLAQCTSMHDVRFARRLLCFLCLTCACSGEEPPSVASEPVPPTTSLACVTGRADCNLELADGCEVALSSDAAHCGRCGNSCGFALCEAGGCAPAPKVIATGQDGVCGVATNGAEVFWSNCRDGRIRSHGAGGLGTKTLAVDQPWVYDIATDGAEVWWSTRGNWSEKGGIRRVSTSGGPVSEVVEDDDVWGIALGADRVYWTRWWLTDEGAEGAVVSMPKAGGTKSFIALTPGSEIAVDGSAVFWHDPSASVILRADMSSGQKLVLADAHDLVSSLAVHGEFVFWTDGNGLFRVPATGGDATLIDRAGAGVALAAPTVYYATWSHLFEWDQAGARALAAIPGSVGGMAVLGEYVYFGDFNENVVVRVKR